MNPAANAPSTGLSGDDRSHRPPYRPDIDGLRAIAVLAVMLSHLKVPHLGGGYIGVDIFFVISGYVIYGDMVARRRAGEFALLDFYRRRIRRLAPQLLAMLIVVTAVCMVLFLPTDFERIPLRVLSAMLGVSNWLFAHQAGYFMPSSEWNVVLHTWTLSVELQFYLVFPVFLIAVARLDEKLVGPALALIAAVSLALCLLHGNREGEVFYNSLVRAWEFLAGCILYHLEKPKLRRWQANVMAFGAMATILLCCGLLTRDGAFPDWRALLPVIATATLIVVAPDSSIATPLRSPWMIGIGRMSYALYLWHWPVIVFATYVWPGILEQTGARLVLLSITFAVSYLSWAFLEVPYRQVRIIPTRTFAKRIAMMTASLSLMVGFAALANGWPARFTSEVNRLDSFSGAVNSRRDLCHRDNRLDLPLGQSCRYGAGVAPSIAVWSDSHGVELIAALDPLLKGRGLAAEQLSFSSCPPRKPVRTPQSECEKFNVNALSHLLRASGIKTVIVAAATDNSSYRSGGTWPVEFRQAIDALRAGGKRVILIYPIPSQAFPVPRAMANKERLGTDYSDAVTTRAQYIERTGTVFSIYDGLGSEKLARIYPDRIFCKTGSCIVSIGNVPLYYDDNHPSLAGAALLASAVNLAIDR